MASSKTSPWITVGKSRRHRRAQRVECCAVTLNNVEMPPRLTETIEAHIDGVKALRWWSDLINSLSRHRPCGRLFGYGLGSVFSSKSSQWQLGLLLAIRDSGVFDSEPIVQVYDPCVSSTEIDFLRRRFNCEEAPVSPPQLDAPTLIYMPHCPQNLYAALIDANDDRLHLLILLGNSLLSYATRSLDLHPKIAAVLPRVIELPCDPGNQDAELERAFNDTALVSFLT